MTQFYQLFYQRNSIFMVISFTLVHSTHVSIVVWRGRLWSVSHVSHKTSSHIVVCGLALTAANQTYSQRDEVGSETTGHWW